MAGLAPALRSRRTMAPLVTAFVIATVGAVMIGQGFVAQGVRCRSRWSRRSSWLPSSATRSPGIARRAVGAHA